MSEIKLDVKDKKILGELFDNAKKPLSEIAKKVGLSKEVVNYRVKRLQECGLVVGYNTVIDIKRIGWEIYFVSIRLRNIDVETERNILSSLTEHPHIAWVIRTLGVYDIILKVFSKGPNEVNSLVKEIVQSYDANIDEYVIDYLSEEKAVPFSFLYHSQAKQGFQTTSAVPEKKQSLEKVQLAILEKIAKNARISYAELAQKVNVSREVVKYQIKKLEQSKIILTYRPDVIPRILGFNWYLLILQVGKLSHSLERALDDYLLNQPNTTYFYKTIGRSDIQIEIRAKTTQELSEVVMQVRSILKRVLKRHELLMVLDEPKYTYYTPCLKKK